MTKGVRVMLTEAGLKFYTTRMDGQATKTVTWKGRIGSIGHVMRNGMIRVHWDGCKRISCDALPEKFLVKVS